MRPCGVVTSPTRLDVPVTNRLLILALFKTVSVSKKRFDRFEEPITVRLLLRRAS